VAPPLFLLFSPIAGGQIRILLFSLGQLEFRTSCNSIPRPEVAEPAVGFLHPAFFFACRGFFARFQTRAFHRQIFLPTPPFIYPPFVGASFLTSLHFSVAKLSCHFIPRSIDKSCSLAPPAPTTWFLSLVIFVQFFFASEIFKHPPVFFNLSPKVWFFSRARDFISY